MFLQVHIKSCMVGLRKKTPDYWLFVVFGPKKDLKGRVEFFCETHLFLSVLPGSLGTTNFFIWRDAFGSTFVMWCVGTTSQTLRGMMQVGRDVTKTYVFFWLGQPAGGIICFTPEMCSRKFGMKVELPLFGSTNKDRAGLRSFVWPPILTESPGYHRLTRKFFKIMKLGAGKSRFSDPVDGRGKNVSWALCLWNVLSMAQLVTGCPSLGRNLPKVGRSWGNFSNLGAE